jgi:hypothetical protein
VCGAAVAQIRCGETGGRDVLAVEEHQFFALLVVEEMHETDGHHSIFLMRAAASSAGSAVSVFILEGYAAFFV